MNDLSFITIDNCTELLTYNVDLVQHDIVMLTIYVFIAAIMLLCALAKYFKAYANMVGYKK